MPVDKKAIGARLRAEREAPPRRSREKWAIMIRNAAGPGAGKLPDVKTLAHMIKEWERGDHTPGPIYRPLYTRVTGKTEDELFGEESGANGPVAPSEPNPLAVTTAAVGVIRTMLDAFTASDRQFGGGHAREYATDYLKRIVQPHLHACADTGVFHDLCAVAAEFNLRVASMQLDAHDARGSRALLGAAFTLAQEIDDPTLVAWVLARCGEQDMQENKVERALSYTAGGVGLARRSPPAARSFILVKQALALSMAKKHAETLRVLGEVWNVYNKVGSSEEPEWMRMYGAEHLQHDAGRCLNNLGMGNEAVQAASESLRTRRLGRPHAFSLAVQAIGYAQTKNKEVDRACEVGHELVTATSQLASNRVKIELAKVLDTLRPYQDVAAVRDLKEAAYPVLRGSSA